MHTFKLTTQGVKAGRCAKVSLAYRASSTATMRPRPKRNAFNTAYLIKVRNSNCLVLVRVETKIILKATWLEFNARHSAVFTFHCRFQRSDFHSYQMLITRAFIK